MSEEKLKDNVTIDGKEYELASLPENAKAQIQNIRFVDAQLQQLNNELAIADTARIAYTNAIKSEFVDT